MDTNKNKPKWVVEKEQLQQKEPEILIFIGKLGVDGVLNGKLPNGNIYQWKKRRK